MSAVADLALRCLHYAALLFLFGWTAYRAVGLRGPAWAALGRRDGRRLIILALAALLLSSALQLTSIAAMMGLPVGQLDGAVIEAMLFGTGMGWAFLIRAALLLAALALLIASRPTLAAFCFAGALMTLGWSGHAAATEGTLGLFHRINNGLHLLGAGLWMGAIGWFLHLARAAHRHDAGVPPRRLLAVMHGFAPLGVALVGTVVLTGIVNAQLIFGWENGAAVLATRYGLLLAAKVALVLVMIGFGAHNAILGRRHARADRAMTGDENATLRALRTSLARELTVAVAVVGLVAALGMMSPMTMA